MPLAIESIQNGHGTVPVKPAASLVNGTVKHVVDPHVLAKPNLALWVTKDHKRVDPRKRKPDADVQTLSDGGAIPRVPAQQLCDSCPTGICGSEIHFWKSGRIGDCCVTHDLILGHESAGQVVEVGANVKDFVVGDRVSIEPGVSCFECKFCLSGRYNLCPKVEFSGTPPSHGTMRRFVAHPARFLHKMADSMSYELGALIEPLSVAYNAVVRAGPYLGQPVVIAGAGPIGLSMALCARAAGCHPIGITDLEENRLQQARELGFARTLRIETTWDRLETAERVRGMMGADSMPSIVFECTGAASSIYSACYALENGGTLLQVGCGKPDVELPVMSMGFREINLVTSFRYTQSWPVVLRLVADGVFGDVTKLITHKYPLEKTIEAFETCADRSQLAIKVQIVDE